MESEYDKKGVVRFHHLPMHYSLYPRFDFKMYLDSDIREIKLIDKHLKIEGETIRQWHRAPFSQVNRNNEYKAKIYIDELNKNEESYLEAINEFCEQE